MLSCGELASPLQTLQRETLQLHSTAGRASDAKTQDACDMLANLPGTLLLTKLVVGSTNSGGSNARRLPLRYEFLARGLAEGERSDEPGSSAIRLPQAFLLGALNVMLLYGQMPTDEYYGARQNLGDPFLNAPLQDSCGGTVYFETTKDDYLKALVRLMGSKQTARSMWRSPSPLRNLSKIAI